MDKQPFDGRSKAFYEHLFQKLGLPIETELSVFTSSRTIDIVVLCLESNRPAIQNTIFEYFSSVNDLELKGENDPLTLDGYYLIVLRAYGLAHKKEMERIDQKSKKRFLPSDMTITIICVSRPDTILDTLSKEIGFQPTDEPGIYHNPQQIKQWIIHPSELRVVPKNYPLLPLSRGKTLEEFIEVCIRDGLNEYLEFIIDLGMHSDPNTILKKLLEVQEMSEKFQPNEETVVLMDRVFEAFPEMVARMSTFSTALEEREEVGVAKGVTQGVVLGKQDTLIRLIKHKFDDIPTVILTMCEDNKDIDLLNNWINIALIAEDTESIIVAWRETLQDD